MARLSFVFVGCSGTRSGATRSVKPRQPQCVTVTLGEIDLKGDVVRRSRSCDGITTLGREEGLLFFMSDFRFQSEFIFSSSPVLVLLCAVFV